MKFKEKFTIAFAFLLFTSTSFAVSDAGYAIAAFRDGCLKKGLNPSQTFKVFSDYGFINPTKDKLVFEWKGVGYAGLGHTALEGSEDEFYSGGCFVYLKGTPIMQVATTINNLLTAENQDMTVKKISNDFYWILPKINGSNPLIIVSEKDAGDYAGHVLMMISELK